LKAAQLLEIVPLSLHDALPISAGEIGRRGQVTAGQEPDAVEAGRLAGAAEMNGGHDIAGAGHEINRRGPVRRRERVSVFDTVELAGTSRRLNSSHGGGS